MRSRIGEQPRERPFQFYLREPARIIGRADQFLES